MLYFKNSFASEILIADASVATSFFTYGNLAKEAESIYLLAMMAANYFSSEKTSQMIQAMSAIDQWTEASTDE